MPVYTTAPILINLAEKLNLLYFKISDRDTDNASVPFNPSLFELKTNDSSFDITLDTVQNLFAFNYKGSACKLQYNINTAHRYVIEVTVRDKGTPVRSSKAIVFVPLINYNCNPPQFTAPVTIAAAITLKPGSQLGILNAWDIDGDSVHYELSSNQSKNLKLI